MEPVFYYGRNVESRIAEQDHVYERNKLLFRYADCAVHGKTESIFVWG
jgi:hypothetical protein